MKKIFIIAGESSGDKIGGLLINRLKEYAGEANIRFSGVGGENMRIAGLHSIFDIKEISFMGFFEILPHIFKLKKLIQCAVDEITKFDPDVVITIDSPGFCYRVASHIKGRIRTKLVHIVAPSVWAYKPERAKKFAKIYDLLLTLLPFEPQYFIKEGLNSIFVGHFAFEQSICSDKEFVRKKYHIDKAEKIICLTPGSRNGEIKRHLPIFAATMQLLQQKDKIRFIFIAANLVVKALIEEYLEKENLTNCIVTCEDKFAVYKASDVALAKSGTNSLEIAMHETPQIVAYKLNFLSWLYIKSVALIKYATLVNIIADKEIIPEFLQNKCNPIMLANAVTLLLEDEKIRNDQIKATKQILESMKCKDMSASALATKEILTLI